MQEFAAARALLLVQKRKNTEQRYTDKGDHWAASGLVAGKDLI